MGAIVAPLLSALACGIIILLPFLLRSRTHVYGARNASWRDELPFFLRSLQPLVRGYASGVDAGLDPQARDTLQKRLNVSGAGYMVTPAEFVVIRRVMLVCCFLLSAYIVFVLGVRKPAYVVTLLIGLPALGYFYPDIWMRDAMKRRHSVFGKDFPFLLDVLVLSIKAGLTFTAAVEQAVEQVRDGPVKQEFARYLREVRTGVTRRVALERLSGRVDIPAVTNFVASVTQAEETGGSLGDVLADQARQRRLERFLRAEKLANQAPVKLLFPLIAFLFPVTFIIIGFVIVMQLMDSGALGLIHH